MVDVEAVAVEALEVDLGVEAAMGVGEGQLVVGADIPAAPMVAAMSRPLWMSASR